MTYFLIGLISGIISTLSIVFVIRQYVFDKEVPFEMVKNNEIIKEVKEELKDIEVKKELVQNENVSYSELDYYNELERLTTKLSNRL